MAHQLLVLALLVFCLFLTVGVNAGNLYPACGGKEYSAIVSAHTSSTLFTFDTPMKELTMNCLAYEVTSVKGGQHKKDKDTDFCRVEHQTAYAYRLSLRASFKNESGLMVTRDYDIDDIAGGSIAKMVTRVPQASTFSIVFTNQADNRLCSMKARLIVDYSSGSSSANESQGSSAPVLVGVNPPTIYAGSSARAVLTLQYPDAHTASTMATDLVTLISVDSTCLQPKDIRYTDYVAPAAPASPSPSDHRAKRSYFFDDAGEFRVCFRGGNVTASVEIATVKVFGSNPAYFDIVEGLSADGTVQIGVPTTIKFFGYDLDTRPDGDRAKFVYDGESCEAGAPAGGVPLATDLGPADDYGPNTTYTLWSWKIMEFGAFKVCYKRRKAGSWAEVPYIDDVAPGGAVSTPSPSSYPVPTDPSTQAECPMAPASTPEHPWLRYKSIKLVLEANKIPDDFLSTAAQIFCVPQTSISLTHVTHNSDGNQVVYLALLCKTAGVDTCDASERLNYIAFLGSTASPILRMHGIKSAEGSTSMFAFGDDSLVTVTRGMGTAAASILSASLIIVAGLLVFAVIKYNEKRQYFVQFAMDDDDDIDDMYEAGAVPMPASAVQRNRYPGAGDGPIAGAVIEMED